MAYSTEEVLDSLYDVSEGTNAYGVAFGIGSDERPKGEA